jgi:4-amino-4-deoxy-L-arabinose transferase-like glycosyltransferase
LLLGVLSIVTLLQTSPWIVRTPGNDSGIFLYFGEQILRGRQPFVDLWDHKPPLVFYLNALGLFLGGGSRWGVWAIEAASLITACVFAFLFLRRYFHTWPALLAVLGMLVNLAFVLEGGNLTEEYALAFQFTGLYVFSILNEEQRTTRKAYLVGAMMGGAFLLKQTLIGVWIGIAIYLVSGALFARARRGLVVLAEMLAGFLLAILASAVPFILRGGLLDYWDVAFRYNFIYSGVATPDRLNSLLDVLWFLNTRAGFFMLASMAWLAGWGYILLHHQPAAWHATRRWAGLVPLGGAVVLLWNGFVIRPFELYAFSMLSPYRWSLICSAIILLLLSLVFFIGWPERRVYPWLKSKQLACDAPELLPLYVAMLDLPVSSVLVAISGRGYLHYYLALFPAVTILVAFLAWSLASAIKTDSEQRVPAVWSVVLLLPVAFAGVAFTIQKIHPGADLQTTRTVEYIQEHTGPEDTILMWGTQTGIYFLSGRASPTRYVHQIPLWNTRYATRDRIEEFLSDLQDKKPALIIDTRLRSMPLVYQEGNPEACGEANPGIPQGMERVYAYICGNYKPVKVLEPDRWIVYQYNPAVLIDRKTGN